MLAGRLTGRRPWRLVHGSSGQHGATDDARRNVELKARNPDPALTAAACTATGAEERAILHQRDTYFRHRLQVTTPADAAALARRTGLADPRGRLIRGLPAPIVAGGVCDAAAIWRGAFLAAGSLTEPHRFPALDITCPAWRLRWP